VRLVAATALGATILAFSATEQKAPATPQAGECGGCHAAETAEWNSSLHHSAFTDRDFQASFAIEREKFCSDCHAANGEAAGIGCKSCHASESGHGAPRTDCAKCHEFAFPHRNDLMQSTIREHAESDFRETSCTACHMSKASDGHRDHRFSVSRNPEFMKRAFAMKTTRTADGVQIEVTPKNVGHELPTGDLFRRVRVIVRSESAEGAPLGQDEILLGRRFDERRREIADTRLAGPRRFMLGGEWLTKAARITVEARYERVAQTSEARDARGGWQRRDSVFGHVVLAEAVLE
jgi:hypothetical protein